MGTADGVVCPCAAVDAPLEFHADPFLGLRVSCGYSVAARGLSGQGCWRNLWKIPRLIPRKWARVELLVDPVRQRLAELHGLRGLDGHLDGLPGALRDGHVLGSALIVYACALANSGRG
jgi:hypothetical protein